METLLSESASFKNKKIFNKCDASYSSDTVPLSAPDFLLTVPHKTPSTDYIEKYEIYKTLPINTMLVHDNNAYNSCETAPLTPSFSYNTPCNGAILDLTTPILDPLGVLNSELKNMCSEPHNSQKIVPLIKKNLVSLSL